MKTNPQELKGNWTKGWALDMHSTAATSRAGCGFEMVRTEMGEAIFLLKYRGQIEQLEVISDVVTEFIRAKAINPDVLIGTQPSIVRTFQPVAALASSIGKKLGVPVSTDYLVKVKDTPPAKELDSNERKLQLRDAFRIESAKYRGKTVLLFDDLFGSGDTLNAITATLFDQGGVAKVCVVTATMNRTRR